MKPKIFYAIVFGFLLGNLLEARSLFTLPTALFLSLLASVVLIFIIRRAKKNLKVFAGACLIAISFSFAFSLGILRLALSEYMLKAPELEIFEDGTIEMIGVVQTEPVRKTDLMKSNIEINAVSLNNRVTKVDKETILVYVDSFHDISYGDLVTLKGRLERIKNREEESNFDYVYYSKKDGILYQVFRPEIKVQKNVGNPIVLRLKSVKNFFESKLAEHLSEPHASLVSGMLIAGKGALPKDIQDEFIRTGLIHIVVLSGFNIAIIIKFLSSMLSLMRLNRRISFALILAALVLFVLMAGATPPVIRAVLMASVILIGKMSYRKMDANRVLFFIAFILALINPYSVPFDPSFQLSFLATFAIINLTPIFERYFVRIRNSLLRETVSQTCAATILVSPFVLYLMGNFSVVAIFVNVLLLPLVPILMLFGFLLVLVSFVPFLPLVVAFIVVALSSILFAVVHFASSLPFASFTVLNLSIWWIIPVYAGLLWFLYKKKREVPAPVFSLTDPH